ncbi:DUF4132 domain-containing protein [Streptomyces kaniharaensis]|uniref:DUF4132 domain-containing protein n=1 Tax=Streptomyces kaniharaensis TaxID=212423 RepID=UPI002DDD31F8|nr:DUF4132 domain-containing protein [Streptomyces kaniharaensis]
MRRWEFVGDGSAKFWEAEVKGASVRVRYGRIGAEGRLQLKELGSDDAARAQFDKLVAEKERKGYVEVASGAVIATAPQPEPEPAGLPDEDTFVLPAAWRKLVRPRRGGRVRAVTPPRPEAGEQEERRIASERDWIEQVLTDRHADPALVRAARAYLAGEADPVGAAVLSGLLPTAWYSDKREDSPYPDAWVTRHGLAFAARAVVELLEVEVGWQERNSVRTEPRLRFRGPTESVPRHIGFLASKLVRELLAAADDATYEEAVAALAECRTTPRRRVMAAYLVPGTPGWADDCIDDEPGYGDGGDVLRSLLMYALDDPAQVERLGPAPRLPWNSWTTELIASLADVLGTACVPFLGEAIERVYGSDGVRSITSAVAQFPTDDAFRLLLARLDDKHTRPALQEAMQRYPVRATRLLAAAASREGKNATAARQLLTTHVLMNRAILPELLAQVDESTAELVRSLDGVRERVADAAPEALPPVLVSPPWTRKRTARKPRVLDLPRPEDEPQLMWRSGERERWAAREDDYTGWPFSEPMDWEAEAARVLGNEYGGLWYAARLVMQGPEELLTPFVQAWRPTDVYCGREILSPVVAKYGLAALPAVVSVAQAKPGAHAELLMPYLDVPVARIMADGMARLKSLQTTARSWFARHGIPAGLLLVPDAVGPVGRDRNAAEQALRLVASAEGAEALLAAVTDRYGKEAAEIVADALAADPLENALPARMPVLPAWVQPAVLPQLLLTEGGALPEESARHVLMMLALSKPGDPYPGLAAAVDVCRADSLAAFAWALFEEWRQAAMPAKESWTLSALGFLGDDETVRRLTPILRDWPGQGAHHRAVEGLGVLAAIGSDVALLHLHGIAQRVKFKALKERAHDKIAEVAEGLGLTGEQLSDRLVPDLGLDADGTTVVDYGPRHFTVGFDEQLRPFVLDADGKRRKDLPTPGVKDDQELAPAERKRFVALKKDVRTIASDQIRRLEAAMVAGRGWTAAEFRELFLQHPLVWHLVRRLVWLADDADGATTAFRVAEDRTFADVDDDEFTLPEDGTVRLAHPLHLGEAVTAWSELFADYEILQPFPQLGRAVRRVTPEEAAVSHLHRFEGCTVPVGRLLGLTKRGWERGTPQDAGIERWFSKKLTDGCYLVIALNEGIAVGVLDIFPDQTFETVWLAPVPGDFWRRSARYPMTFGELDPVLASELLVDLEEVTAK